MRQGANGGAQMKKTVMLIVALAVLLPAVNNYAYDDLNLNQTRWYLYDYMYNRDKKAEGPSNVPTDNGAKNELSGKSLTPGAADKSNKAR